MGRAQPRFQFRLGREKMGWSINTGAATGAVVEITEVTLGADAATIGVSGMDADYSQLRVVGQFGNDNVANQGLTMTLNTVAGGGFGLYMTAIAAASYSGNKIGEVAPTAADKVKTGVVIDIVNSQTADYFTTTFANAKDGTYWWSSSDWYDLAGGVTAIAFAIGGGANFRKNSHFKVTGVKA